MSMGNESAFRVGRSGGADLADFEGRTARPAHGELLWPAGTFQCWGGTADKKSESKRGEAFTTKDWADFGKLVGFVEWPGQG